MKHVQHNKTRLMVGKVIRWDVGDRFKTHFWLGLQNGKSILQERCPYIFLGDCIKVILSLLLFAIVMETLSRSFEGKHTFDVSINFK